jgi:hypothetical protein
VSIKLIAVDIDGTLLNTRWELPEANRIAVERAVARGVEVALVTGRRFDFARPIASLIDAPLTMVVSNGAVVKTKAGETLAKRPLARAIAARVLDRTRAYRAAAAVLFDRPREGQVVFERIDPASELIQRFLMTDHPFVSEVCPLEDCLIEDPIQIMYTGSVGPMRTLSERLLEAGGGGPEGGCQFAVAVTEYERRDFALVDVLQAGCSKGAAIEAWARARGYAREEVMAIGDNLNDREMLAAAGLPVVMRNAVPALLETGWLVTASNDEEGVARAIERHVLAT